MINCSKAFSVDYRKKIALAALFVFYINKKKRRKPRFWHKPWIGDYQRQVYSFSHNLEPLIFKMGAAETINYIRVDSHVYQYLLEQITPLITKRDTSMRLAITPKEKLSITLSYLAEGLSLRRLSYEYRVGVSTVGQIVDETINALLVKICPTYLAMPTVKQEWIAIADRFSREWQFPNCLGAVDGKHVHLFPPRNSGSLYYNYKEGFSIVLMALVDADYKFIGIDVGANGKCCDTGIWGASNLRTAFADNTVGIPEPSKLPNSLLASPYVILGDSGFQLEEFLMRPFGEKNITPRQRVFNYRLSRARRVSENAFGILANRWRILMSRMLVSPEKATAIVTLCCALHNLLCSKNEEKMIYIPDGFVDKEDPATGDVLPGLWRKLQLPQLDQQRATNSTANAKQIREMLKDYFNDEGKVSWQNRYAVM